MSQLRSSLLGDKKKLDTFEKSYDDCVYRIKKIKQKNDTLQKNAGTELEDEIAVQVQKQKEFIEEEIRQLKEQMDQIERKYRDPEAKNKMKVIKKEAQREIERNKTVLRQFINRSFLNVKQAKRSKASIGSDDQDKYFQGGKASIIDDDNAGRGNKTNGYYHNAQDNYNNRDSQDYAGYGGYGNQQNKQHQESELEIDYQLEKRLEDQKDQLLKNVQKDAQKILNIVTDTANEVYAADEKLDLITDNVVDANKNVVTANEKMEQASELQKKARKKYICCAAIILLAVILAVGIILIVKYH